MKNYKRVSALLFAVVFVFLVLCSCGRIKVSDNIPDPTDVFYVYDEADVLDGSLEEYIVGRNADLYNKCGGQIVVSCVKTTGSEDIADYAREMFNKWGVGSSEKNNGVLVLLSIEEDDYWVLQGKGLEDLLQSGTLKLLLNDKLEPYFAKKQYADGVRALFDALVEKFEQIYSITAVQLPADSVGSYTPEPEDVAATEKEPVTAWKVITTVSSIVVAFTVIVILLIIIITVVITVFIIIASVFSAGSGVTPPRGTFRGGINVNPHSFRPSGTFHGGFTGGSHHSGGFTFGGSHHGGGFTGGSHHGGGGFSGGSHHSGGGGFSRGGGAGRR
ncbi:MAG: TPM domain-containing protein [Clostridia bacterium]|nr:TPM domain-containing protein [Clostridia bacterium]